MLVIFVLGQRSFVEGIATTGRKGRPTLRVDTSIQLQRD
jgi:hypothetical protein